MKRYIITSEIREVARQMAYENMDPAQGAQVLAAINSINEWGWRFPDGSRVVLDRAELGWALDLAFAKGEEDEQPAPAPPVRRRRRTTPSA